MTRKGATTVDRQNSEISYYADDEDGNRKKYTKRGKHAIGRMTFVVLSQLRIVLKFVLCYNLVTDDLN